VHLDEPVRRCNRQGGLALLVVRIRNLDLRLLREAPVRITRFELLVILDRLIEIAVVQVRFGF
jgi:hypothetical protein